MHIDPTLSAAENVIELVTNPALGLPVNPEYLAVGKPMPYDPAATVAISSVYGKGLNVDGLSSNTAVVVFERPSLEDVTDDGVSQLIIYRRVTLAQAISPKAPNVTMAQDLNASEIMAAIASQLGLISEELYFNSPSHGNPATIQIATLGTSLAYLMSLLTVNVTYS
jgi:hypothetical protein